MSFKLSRFTWILQSMLDIPRPRPPVLLLKRCTAFTGFLPRFERVLRSAMQGSKLEISQSENPQLDVWKGGSLLGSLSTFEGMCVLKETYDEIGPSVIERFSF